MLDIIIIFREEDAKYLPECVSTLPDWAHINIVKTIQLQKGDDLYENVYNSALLATGGLDNLQTKDNITLADYLYIGDFNFSKARNVTKALAQHKWILMLDADERLLRHQHDNLKLTVEKLLQTLDAGGVFFHVMSCQKDFATKTMNCLSSPQVRMFLNDPGIKYIGASHETVDLSIAQQKLDIYPSTFKIDHVGYEGNEDEILNKLKRNVATAVQDIDVIFEHQHYKNILIRDLENYYKIKGVKNGS